MTVQSRRILVTGAAGVVGEETIRALLDRDDSYQIIAFDLPTRGVKRRLRQFGGKVRVALGDLADARAVSEAVQGVDAVIHLAAIIPPAADRDTLRATEVNVGGTQILLQALAERMQPVRFIYTSSVAIYGDRLASPWIQVGDRTKPGPRDHYARTKLAAEELVCGSATRWTVFRLTGVLSHRLSMNPLMFEMPLDTSFESITARDTGFALAKALEVDELEGQIYNLGGGSRCRAKYREYLDEHLSIMGLGRGFFPDAAFGESDFHCGYFRDSGDLQALLQFQRDGLEDWWDEVKKNVHPLVPIMARATRPLLRWLLLKQSKPLATRRSQDAALSNLLARPSDANHWQKDR